MALDFPLNPQVGNIYTEGNRTWTWNGRYWKATSTTIGYTGSLGRGVNFVGNLATESLLPLPYSGEENDAYVIEATGILWIWDGSSWGPVGQFTGYTGSRGDTGYAGSEGYTGSVGESTFTWGATPPENPDIGARWYDTITGCMTVYVDDGDSQQWVEVAASGFVGQPGYTGSSGGVNTVTTFPTAINSDVTIAVGENGLSVGPLTQAPGTVITIAAGQRWIIL